MAPVASPQGALAPHENPKETCMNRRNLVALAAATAYASALPGAAFAQADYPSTPVKIICPFPAGGTSDDFDSCV